MTYTQSPERHSPPTEQGVPWANALSQANPLPLQFYWGVNTKKRELRLVSCSTYQYTRAFILRISECSIGSTHTPNTIGTSVVTEGTTTLCVDTEGGVAGKCYTAGLPINE